MLIFKKSVNKNKNNVLKQKINSNMERSKIYSEYSGYIDTLLYMVKEFGRNRDVIKNLYINQAYAKLDERIFPKEAWSDSPLGLDIQEELDNLSSTLKKQLYALMMALTE